MADKNCEKIHFMAPNIYCCGAGTAADTEAVTGTCKSTHLIPHYQHPSGTTHTVRIYFFLPFLALRVAYFQVQADFTTIAGFYEVHRMYNIQLMLIFVLIYVYFHILW